MQQPQPVTPQPATAPPAPSALFFDDDSDNLHTDHALIPHVRLVSVACSSSSLLFAGATYPYCTAAQMQAYVGTLGAGAQRYVKGVQLCGLVEHYDPHSGISLTQLTDWTRYLHEYREVLLDWDRTLTVFEGLPTSPPHAKDTMHTMADVQALFRKYFADLGEPPTAADLAEVYFGGATRVAQLRAFLTRAHDAGCKLIILTRNPRAREEDSGRPLFHEMLTACVGGDGSDAAWVKTDIELHYVPYGVSKCDYYARLKL